MMETMARPGSFRSRAGLIEGSGFFLLVIVILFCAGFSLWPRRTRSFKNFKADDCIQVTGSLTMPDRSGQAKILFTDQVSYQGGLKKGRFSGPGTLTYKDGRKIEAEFKEGQVSRGKITLKNGQEWQQKEDGSWELLKK